MAKSVNVTFRFMCSALWKDRHDDTLHEIIEDNNAGNLRITKATGWENLSILHYVFSSKVRHKETAPTIKANLM